MLDIPSDHFSVTAVLLKKVSQHRWARHSWSLLGVIPGLSETQLSNAQTEGDLFTPVVLTVDFDEAASYMEAGDHVMEAALPDELCVWLERFLIYHYAPEAPKKRRRERWKDNDGGAR